MTETYVAEWRLSNKVASILYKAVFLPRITYASRIWVRAVRTKARNCLGRAQKRPLLSTTKTYRTTSTDVL